MNVGVQNVGRAEAGETLHVVSDGERSVKRLGRRCSSLPRLDWGEIIRCSPGATPARMSPCKDPMDVHEASSPAIASRLPDVHPSASAQKRAPKFVSSSLGSHLRIRDQAGDEARLLPNQAVVGAGRLQERRPGASRVADEPGVRGIPGVQERSSTTTRGRTPCHGSTVCTRDT
jgi:hypothetical protein